MIYCKKCGNEILDGDLFCRKCGAPYEEDADDAEPTQSIQSKKRPRRDKCPACGEPISPLDKVCPLCGYDLSELTRADREEKIASVQNAVGSAKNAVKSAEEHVLKLGGCGKVLWAFIILYAFMLIAQLGTGLFSGLSKALSHPSALISVAILIGLFFYLQKKER